MERFGGFVARYVGDGILVYFGYPIAHENDAERALRAALELLERLRNVDTIVEEHALPPLAARIGISTGLVLVAPEMLSGGAAEHSVVGEAVNLAARLQAEASTGTVVISKETFDLVQGLFECTELGPRPIKGLSRDVLLYQVLRPVPGARRLASRPLRMVGRHQGLEELLSSWKIASKEGRCRTIEIIGEAGIGKTRLVVEFCRRAELIDATLVQTNCHELFANTPLYPVASFLWARIGVSAEDDESQRLYKIELLLNELRAKTPENLRTRHQSAGARQDGYRRYGCGDAFAFQA